jgi:hypothetical protein
MTILPHSQLCLFRESLYTIDQETIQYLMDIDIMTIQRKPKFTCEIFDSPRYKGYNTSFSWYGDVRVGEDGPWLIGKVFQSAWFIIRKTDVVCTPLLLKRRVAALKSLYWRIVERRKLAVAMAWHERLGHASLLAQLPVELIWWKK